MSCVLSLRTAVRAGSMVILLGICPFSPAQSITGPAETQPLTTEGDLASHMVDGIDRFLLRSISEASAARTAHWTLDLSSDAALQTSLKLHRDRLAACLGIRDARLPNPAPQLMTSVGAAATLATGMNFDVYAIRWPVLGDPRPQGAGRASICGEGLLLVPRGEIRADVIVLTDADQTPEQICGLADGIPEASQVARDLASAGCRVVIPDLISRHLEKRNGRSRLSSREYLHRAAFELGRTLAGYETQSVLSLVDWFAGDHIERPIGVFGYGEGGMLALFAAGLDTRIQSTCVSGFFGPREQCWNEPLDRNFFSLLSHFGATELALLLSGRRLVVETSRGPELTLPGEGGAPAELKSPDPAEANQLLEQARSQITRLAISPAAGFFAVHPPERAFGSAEALRLMLIGLGIQSEATFVGAGSPPQPVSGGSVPDATAREHRLLQDIDLHNQALLQESHFVREKFMAKLDTSSLEKYSETVEPYRNIFRDDVIGAFQEPLLPFNARSRASWNTDKWTGHEVVLEVFPDVFAYGVLLLPRDLKPGEKRPVVVCQHGLEGRPTDVFLNDHPAYHDFAAKLCERGFITFAPQNPYIFKDRFRTLQRKAQPLGKSLFSIIVPQHQQMVNWLKTQPFVDSSRIAFYGLSYGGKSAMRIPALVTDYCLSICSADFNEWVLKNASSRHAFSYIWTGEYEIFEWDLGSTFNYAEMAALICPRPFMVERGHFDGVGEDQWVGYEYARVRNLYAARLKIGDRTEIEWFDGPHTIHGQGTYDFLHRHLQWPKPTEKAEPPAP